MVGVEETKQFKKREMRTCQKTKKKKKKRCASKTRNMPRGDGECKKMRQHRREINLSWGRAEKTKLANLINTVCVLTVPPISCFPVSFPCPSPSLCVQVKGMVE